MDFEDLSVRVDGQIGIIELNRGDGRNALRVRTMEEICRAFDLLGDDPGVRAILFTASGKHFSTGADFAFLARLTTMSAVEIRDQIYSAFQGAAKRIWNCPKPTVAAVNGFAVTVGCELALACDFRIAGPRAQFQESWIKLGIMPPLGGLFLLPRMIGLARANEMVLTARAVAAEEALRIGLVSRAADTDDALPGAALDYARELAALPPLAYRAIKDAVHRGLESSMEKEWASNLLAQSILLGTDDFSEGLAAVTERRPADFKGR
ncbi:enoyl-CoA hydratase/isomerase family protein [Sphingomonas sp. SRS2]|uniref:enoyl-CoA hydratase/isomerase family protein n=1 Tax=Sphingomonas sp. SRS2 TaxID=133190 RepID=UPI000AEE2339|nr:enoyl-CoA hydratase/isomerase family protein [Sphingomonas sp. SRS2]